MKVAIAAGFLLCAAHAWADTPNNVTLVIENDAGMVTQVPDMTQRECDGIVSLLEPRMVTLSGSGPYFGTYVNNTNNTLDVNVYGSVKVSTSSRLTTAHCVVPTGK